MKKDKGKKVLHATSDHEASDDDDEFGLREFCFMAHDDEDIQEDMEEEDQGELQLAFDELFSNSLDLARKNKELKLQVEKLINENTQLIDENKKLKDETHDLHFQILHISNKLKVKEGLIKMGESSGANSFPTTKPLMQKGTWC